MQLLFLFTAIVAVTATTNRNSATVVLRSVFTQTDGFSSFYKNCTSVVIDPGYAIAPAECVKENGREPDLLFIPATSVDVIDSNSGIFYSEDVLFSQQVTFYEKIALIKLPSPYGQQTSFCIAEFIGNKFYFADTFVFENSETNEKSFVIETEKFLFKSYETHGMTNVDAPYDKNKDFVSFYFKSNVYSIYFIDLNDYAEWLERELKKNFKCGGANKLKKRRSLRRHHTAIRKRNRASSRISKRSKRFVAGDKVPEAKYPYVVKLHLISRKSPEYVSVLNICTGTVISRKYIITAKHCFVSDINVILVETRPIWPLTDGINFSRLGVAKTYHKYDGKNDIGLVEMPSVVSFESQVAGIATPEYYKSVTNFIALGFGCTRLPLTDKDCAADHYPLSLMKTNNGISEWNEKEQTVVSTATKRFALSGDSGGLLLIDASTSFSHSKLLMGVLYGSIDKAKSRGYLISPLIADWITNYTSVNFVEQPPSLTAPAPQEKRTAL